MNRVIVAFVIVLGWLLAVELAATQSSLDRWRAADLFHVEYNQDLAAVLTSAREMSAAATTPDERASARLFEARIRRLRGEYRTAGELLEQGEAEATVRALRVLLLNEKRVVEVERYQTPWGTLTWGSNDSACTRPDLERSRQRHVQEHARLSAPLFEAAKMHPARGAAVREAVAIEALASTMETHAVSLDFVGRMPDGGPGWDQLVPKTLDAALGEIERVVGAGSAFMDAGRAARLKRRLLIGPLGARGDATRAERELPCAATTAAVDGHTVDDAHALPACAELDIFFGGRAESLAVRIPEPGQTETSWIQGSAIWSAAEIAAQHRAHRSASAARWLDRAAEIFTERGHRRDAARTLYVRASRQVIDTLAMPGVDAPTHALTHAFLEGEQVARVHDVTVQKRATRAELLDALAGHKVVHLVAHGRSTIERAGTVIAPLWRVADAPPVLEVIAALRRGEPATRALAIAQRAAIARGVAPAHRAGFLALGGRS